MFDRFKDFIGIDDNYDEYDDEQLYYDDDPSTDSHQTSTRENYSELMDDDYSYDSSETSTTYESGYSSTSDSSYGSSYADSSHQASDYSYEPQTYGTSRFKKSSKRGDNVVSMTENNFNKASQMRISIQEPLDYQNDAPVVVDEIINKKVVVLNLEMADADMRRQIIDFVSGAVYALEGKIEKVTKGIFVITPRGVEVDSSVTDQISDGNYNQL